MSTQSDTPAALANLPPRFDLPLIFRRAVELGDAVKLQAQGQAAVEKLTDSLRWALNPRQARFPVDSDWDFYLCKVDAGLAPQKGDRLPRPGWKQEVELSDISPSARQALLTIGMALADLRGDNSFRLRGFRLLGAGTWNLWDGMMEADREAVKAAVSIGARTWDWSTTKGGTPSPFRGSKADLSDYRVLSPGWRTGGVADITALHDCAVGGREAGLAVLAANHHLLPVEPPVGLPGVIANAYRATARALILACAFKAHVLPAIGNEGRCNRDRFSGATRQRVLQLPGGDMTTEDAATELVNRFKDAETAYSEAERLLLPAAEPGTRCAFRSALGWVRRVEDICRSAIDGKQAWDQAALAIQALPGFGPVATLEAMRKQTGEAARRDCSAPSPSPKTTEVKPLTHTRRKPGEAQYLIVNQLLIHHRYHSSELNLTKAVQTDLAKAANVKDPSVSDFMKKHFPNYDTCRRTPNQLRAELGKLKKMFVDELAK